MKLISHRGNLIGPNPSKENSPSYIDTAILAGYDVEIDVFYENGDLYLGHDKPEYKITETWLQERKDKLWIHCKNLEAATILSELGQYQIFCHSSDLFVLTSNRFIWVHDLSIKLTNRTIIPLLNAEDVIEYNGGSVYAVCTDYITLAEYHLKQKGL